MHIEKVKIDLVEDVNPGRSHVRLRAFACIQFVGMHDGREMTIFVRDAKVIQGDNELFVGMPSRKVMDHCRECNVKNPLDARFCGFCGLERLEKVDISVKRYADVVFPMDRETRDYVTCEVLAAYDAAMRRSREEPC